MKHTPGPWEVLRMRLTSTEKDRRCGFVVNGQDKDPLPVRICDLRVPCGINGFAEGEANARLIAAAPDMLDLLSWVKTKTTDADIVNRINAFETMCLYPELMDKTD